MGASGSVLSGSCPKKGSKAVKMNASDYRVVEFIAEGVSGKVYKGCNERTEEIVALKFFGYTKDYSARHEDIWFEIEAMLAVRGVEGLVQVLGYFPDTKKGILNDKFYTEKFPVIVMEHLRGGPLFGRINYRDSVSEKYISHIFLKMMHALKSLHQKNFIHRDLKLDNVMFLEASYDSPVKIIDLGNIVQLEHDNSVFKDKLLVGTPGCLAPESILDMEYSKKSDIWQAGCILYSLLSGLPPFDHNVNKQITDYGYYPMKGPAWDEISAPAKSLVSKMLKRNSDHRVSVDDILEHPWVVGDAPDRDFSSDYFTRIKHLALRNKMKNFFLENSLLEGNSKRRKSLREALPIFRKASDVALMSSSGFRVIDQPQEVNEDVEAFNNNMKLLKNMVVASISKNISSDKKEIDYPSFIAMLKECNLQDLCSLQVFNIFDIGNTGTIDPREFLLTMLAFRNDTNSTRMPGVNKEEDSGLQDEEIRLYFNIFDINETGFIDLEELKIAVNFLLYMGSDQPQSMPNIHELFNAIDVTQNGLIEFNEFKQFYRHLIASNAVMQ